MIKKIFLAALFFLSILNNSCFSQQQISEFSKDSKLYIKEKFPCSNILHINHIKDSIYSTAIIADKYQVNDVKITEDGKSFYSCGREGVIRKWNSKGELLQSYGQTIYSLNSLVLDEANKLIYAASGSGYIYVWNTESGVLVNDHKMNGAGLSSIYLVGEVLYTSSFDGSIFKTNIKSWASEELIKCKGVEVYDILPVINNYLIVSGRKVIKDKHNLGLMIINVSTGKIIRPFYSIGAFDEGSVQLSKKTSLNLKKYGDKKNKFTIINTQKGYSVDAQGKIEVSNIGDSAFFDNYGYGDQYLEEHIGYGGEGFNGCQYNKSLNLTYCLGNVYRVNEQGAFLSIPYSNREFNDPANRLDSNFTLIITNDIAKSIKQFRDKEDLGADRIVPVVQNNFIATYERVISSDSSFLAISNESKTIKVFNLKKKALLANLESKTKVIRLISHPFAPLFASLHIDGTINIWDFESLVLLNSYAYTDNDKYAKKDAKENPMYHNHYSLNRAVKFNNDESYISFEFSELGDEIRVFQLRDFENKYENFNRLNLFSNETSLVRQDCYHREAGTYRYPDIPIDIKGYSDFLTLEDLEYNFESYRYKMLEFEKKEGHQKVMSIWRSLGDHLKYIVPAAHPSQNGTTLVLDYGKAIYSIDLKTLNNSIIRVEDIPNKYSQYTSEIKSFDPDELFVPRTKYFDTYYFNTRRYIDTAYAHTTSKLNSPDYQKTIREINLDDMSGSEEIDYQKGIRRYYIDEYFEWSPKNNHFKSISHEEYKKGIDFFIDVGEMQGEELEAEWESRYGCESPGNWSDFLDEDYVMESEQYQWDSETFRASYGYTESTAMKQCKYYTTLYYNNKLLIRSMKNDKNFGFIPSQTSRIAAQDYLEEPNYLLTNNINGEINLWNWEEQPVKNPVVTFLGSGEELFVMTPDFYYMALTQKANNIAFRKKGVLFGFEQFDLIYNRPDIVLERLDGANTELIKSYYKAYLKRLKKMNFTEDMLKSDFHLPEIKIENFEYMPTITDSSSIRLNLNIEDSKYKLDRINIWVNDVAVYGTDGVSLRDKDVQSYKTNLDVNLVKGHNKVQVSVLNQAGAESYKESFEVMCTSGKSQPDLYLITIGGSKFKDANYNLTYAAKDAEDIASIFLESKVYKNVKTKTLTNEQVTKENITELRTFFEQADINDEVMVFVAGHGVLDENLDYFFATYDMDFSNPSDRGLAYEDLEGLLDGITPLKKTLLIDACHSGEIDKEEVELMAQETTELGDIQFRAVGKTVVPKLGMQNTSELMKSLFTDLRKGTGATVISSAGGMEFAMESGNWQNGLFTYCLLNGLKSKAADLNNDGEIWLSELKKYVQEQVSLLSKGKQQPTSRIENNTLDYRVW